MASYEASIKVLVEAQQAFRAVKELENRLKNIQDKATKAQIKGVITESAQDVSRAERRLKAQIDLNAATELYQRRLTQINRAGGARNAQQREELAGLAQIIQSQGDNARIVQKVATATGRILEVIRETNRTDKRSNELQSQVRAYQKQFDLLAAQGASQSKLNELAALRDKLSGQQSRKELDLAAITKDQLDRKLKLLTTEIKIKQAAEATAAAERSKLQQQGLALRRLARGVDRLISRAGAINAPAGQLALPSSKLLRAEARGLQRIETSEERIARFAQRTAEAKAKSAVRSADIFEANRKAAKAGERNAKAAERAAAAEERTARAVRRTTRTRASGGAGGGRGRGGNVLVGAAFPALFGAGPAGILGGAIGEAFGPLGGVVGSALGAPVDAFVAKTVEVGQALNSTSSALDFVRENSLFSSKATEELAYQLEELGDVEGVAKLLTEELVEKIGNNGVQALQDLGKESDETTRLWNELTLQLQTLIAGPLTDFLKIVNQVLGSMTTRGRFEALQSDLAGNQEFQTEVNRLRAQRGRGARQGALTIEDMQGLINKFAPTVPKTAKIDITQQDRRNFDRKQANDTKRAAREAQRIALAVLNLNTALLQENLKQFDLKTRYMALSLEEIDRLTEANYRLDERFKLEKQLLEKQREQALVKDPANEYLINKLYDERLDTAQGIVELAKFENQEKIKQIQAAERLAAIEGRTGVAFGALLSQSGMFAEDPLLGRAESPLAFGTGAQMQGLINQELALERIIEKYTEIGEAASLASELVTFGIRDMVSGTRSAEEVFAEFLQNIADMLLRTAATMIAQYIALGIARAFALGQTARVGPEMFNLGNTSFFGNAPALGGLGFGGLRANGGPVGAGQSYIVGERGPELFVPSRSGSIVPNDRLGGGDNVSVVVNVDAKGTSVQGNDQEGNQLGRVLSAAIKAELIKQKRPGGLLA